ncbi:hypothetical protein ACHAXS_000351 [Conticribra weissflogii]
MLDHIYAYKFLKILTFPCSTTPLSLTSPAKNSALLLHRLANTNTNNSLWDSNALMILPNRLWRAMLKTLVCISTILVSFPSIGIKFYCINMDHSNQQSLLFRRPGFMAIAFRGHPLSTSTMKGHAKQPSQNTFSITKPTRQGKSLHVNSAFKGSNLDTSNTLFC